MAKEIVDAAEEEPKTEKKKRPSRRNLLSTGSTLLNLACSDSPWGGFMKGKYYFLVGDSASGKTFLSMTCFAEAVRSRHFKGYRLIYDNVEDGCLLDIEGLFNEATAKRIIPPGGYDKEGIPIYSSTVEEFYYHLDDAIKEGTPFIYVLDSMDSLLSEASEQKFEEQKEAHRKGQAVAGSYGDGKAKKNSEGIRKALKGLRTTNSILIVLSQTRDNLGFGFEKKTRAGGHALRFYATTEIWSSIVKRIKKTVKGKPRNVGVRVKLKVRKNRMTGKTPEVEVEIYPSYGIDDIGSCVDYLVDEGWWTTSKKMIVAKEFDIKVTREKLIQHIEEKNLVKVLMSIVGKCWREIDDACSLTRKKRYTSVGPD